MLDESQQTSLLQLTWMWEKSHKIAVLDGTWTATPLDDPDAVLAAEDAWSLRMLLREDAAERQRRETT